MRVLVPFTVLALFGSTAFAQCQPDGGIGFNVNTGDLNSVRCCSGCGWSSCRLGDSQGTLYYCPSASGNTCNLQPSICG
ncbi:hypothetical protein AA0114_g12225 [Alternaria tenuissima]|uniref:Uncharacterized protein n=1 Tax=Alternaria tenuissima TaxID=119927 RepID=A0A4Q4M213_9PLEO|nr:hypothetical protein AA0114_g12225 [Alternaria tenuissima]